MRNTPSFLCRSATTLCVAGLLASCGAVAQTIGSSPLKPYQPPQPASAEVLQALRAAQAPPLVLRRDDVVAISVFDLPDLNTSQRVNEDGTISYPLLGNIPAAGLTLGQVQASITSQLVAQRLVKSPQVIVTAAASPSRTIAVTGEFQKPTVIPAIGAVRIADCIALAGGFTPTASKGVYLRRSTLAEPVYIPLGPDAATSTYADIPVFSGDSIEAPRRGVVYAVGAFRGQGAYSLKSDTPLTATQVIALAGGIGYEASPKDAQILRVRDGHYVLIAVRLDKILHGKEADVPLESDDVLFVPTNALRAAVKGGGAGLVLSLATSFLLLDR